MDQTLKRIAEGAEYYFRFKRTKIYIIDETPEILLENYTYSDDDEDYSEVIFMPSTGRGILTWLTFNKLERVVKHRIIDHHKNLSIDKLKYSYNPQLDLEIAQSTIYTENGVVLIFALIRKEKEFYVQLIFSGGHDNFRIEFREPEFIKVEPNSTTAIDKLFKLFK